MMKGNIYVKTPNALSSNINEISGGRKRNDAKAERSNYSHLPLIGHDLFQWIMSD